MLDRKQNTAFTLIELLLVVAIIGLLAAIAIPNFLSAQTRAKVSRVRSNLRSLGNAVEAYRVDNGAYPPMWDPVNVPWQYHDDAFFVSLTTPIAFISDIPIDPFRETEKIEIFETRWYDVWESKTYRTYYIYNKIWPEGVAQNKDGSEAWDPEGISNRIKWAIKSTGPDLHYNHYWRDKMKISKGMDPPADYEWNDADGNPMYPDYIRYDSTNGTNSFGDIFQVGP